MDVYANFAYCTLTAGISAADTVLTVDSTARVPDPSLGDVWLASDSTLSAGNFEIVKVVSKTPNTLTVLRGQEGTPIPSATANGTVLRGTLTAAMLERLRPLRKQASATTESLPLNGQSLGTITLAPGYRLYTVRTSQQCRVRLYVDAASQTADAARPLGTDPADGSGLMFEYVTTGTTERPLSPLVDGFVASGSAVPITITNRSAVVGPITATFTYQRAE